MRTSRLWRLKRIYGDLASLIDVNVVVALLHSRHVHTAQAIDWLNQVSSPKSIALNRVVQMGALRVLTNPRALREEVLTASEFWTGWTNLLTDDRFYNLPEPADLEMRWREITSQFSRGQMAETDAYLAAFAILGGHRLVTFDRGFGRFNELDLACLSA